MLTNLCGPLLRAAYRWGQTPPGQSYSWVLPVEPRLELGRKATHPLLEELTQGRQGAWSSQGDGGGGLRASG